MAPWSNRLSPRRRDNETKRYDTTAAREVQKEYESSPCGAARSTEQTQGSCSVAAIAMDGDGRFPACILFRLLVGGSSSSTIVTVSLMVVSLYDSRIMGP